MDDKEFFSQLKEALMSALEVLPQGSSESSFYLGKAHILVELLEKCCYTENTK